MLNRILVVFYTLLMYNGLSNICAMYGDNLQWLAQLLTIIISLIIYRSE